GEATLPAQEGQRVHAVFDHVQVHRQLAVGERLAGHEHVGGAVLDQQDRERSDFAFRIHAASLPFGGEGMKGRALAYYGFYPNLAAVSLDNFLADGQADAGAREGAACVQPLEHAEDALEVPRLDADAVVGNGEVPGAVLRTGLDANGGRPGAAELDGVAEQ